MSRVDPQRRSSGNELPGPGTYQTMTDNQGGGFLGDAPSYSMGARKAVPKPDDASPGPVYSPRVITSGSVGPIGDAPEFSFGSSKRFGMGSSAEPGPGKYDQISTRTGGSMLGDAPKYGFGTAQQRISGCSPRGNRFISKEHAIKSNFAAHSPGPLAYSLEGGLGVASTGSGAPNSPRYTMRPRLVGYQPSGTSATSAGVDQPGPGTYNQAAAIGQQVNSSRTSAAAFSFGTSERHRPELRPKKTMYIGKDYERQNWGIHSPGPSMYSTKATIGATAVVPQYKASPAFSFGSEDRFCY